MILISLFSLSSDYIILKSQMDARALELELYSLNIYKIE